MAPKDGVQPHGHGIFFRSHVGSRSI